MMPVYKYFMIPFASVPSSPPYSVWFASLSSSNATWSKERPTTTADTSTTWAVGLTTNEPPDGATFLGTSTKDPPPPPLALASPAPSLAAYQTQFGLWLDSRSA